MPHDHGRPVRRAWTYRVGAVLLSLLLSLGIGEGLLRLFGPQYHRFDDSSDHYYSNPEGYFEVLKELPDGQIVYGIPTRRSSHGYRIPDDPREPPRTQGEEVVMLLGDSFVYGRGVRYKDTLAARFGRLILRGSGREFPVLNTAREGNDIHDISRTYHRETAKVRPVLTVYGFVLNDFGLQIDKEIGLVGQDFIDQNNGGYAYSPLRDTSALFNLVEHVRDLRRMTEVTARGYLETFRNPRAHEIFKQIIKMDSDMKQRGGSFVLMVFPLLWQLQDYPFMEIHRWLQQACKKSNIRYLDLLPAYQQYRDHDLWVHPTDHHPNRLGHAIAAQELARYVLQENLLPQ